MPQPGKKTWVTGFAVDNYTMMSGMKKGNMDILSTIASSMRTKEHLMKPPSRSFHRNLHTQYIYAQKHATWWDAEAHLYSKGN